jgi:hypothetical protein
VLQCRLDRAEVHIERRRPRRREDVLLSYRDIEELLLERGLEVDHSTLNCWVLAVERAFDPYPFILLNLVLSCLAAVQAPIIMMSQKQQEAKDRLRALNDYRVNLKAELEIRHLHEKLDHLISKQWQRLAEIQELQIQLLQERR